MDAMLTCNEIERYLDETGLPTGTLGEILVELWDALGDEPWPRREARAIMRRVVRSGREARKRRAKARIKAIWPEIIGAELANIGRDRWAFICPDASDPGRIRFSAFDRRGFYTHSTRGTTHEILDEALNDGFTEPAPGSLDRLSGTDEWAAGMDAVYKVARTNRKLNTRP